jgi:predicted flap endonuclease-1-like 5' DNA nuclease
VTTASARRPRGHPPDGRPRTGGSDEKRPTKLRDLPGVGPTMDRKLRESGVTSVADLANATETDLLERLGDVRGLTARRVREWIATARDISSAAAAEPDEPSVVRETGEKPKRTQTTEPPERQESFVLTVSVDEPGHVQRSTIRHTRTGIEDTTPGWSPAQLTTFIARHAGLAASETAAPETTLAGSTTRRPRPRPDREPVRLHLDAGHLAGGGHRSGRLAVGAPVVPWDVARYDYDLTVTARQLGRRRWRPLGRARGRAATGQELVVDVPAADLPPGVHRITLTGHIRPAVPDSPTAIGTPVNAGEATV